MKLYRFDSSRSISSSLSVMLIMTLSLWVAWFVVKKADEIISVAPNLPAFNIEKRASGYK